MIQQQPSALTYYPPYAPVPVPVQPPSQLGYLLDQMRWMAQQPVAPVAPPIPAPTVMGRISKLLKRLSKPASQPTVPTAPPPPKAEAPKPEPKPEPKAPPKPKPKPSAPKAPPADTTRYFLSQYRSASNTREDAPSNGNCGPASLTMVAEAFRKISVSAQSANAAVEATRKRMGAGTSQSSEYNGTSYEQLVRGAKSYGLDAKVYYGKLDVIKTELAKGRLVIAHVRPSYLFPGTTSGHYAVVTKIAGGKVYMNDPANPRGQTVLSESTFLRAQKERGAYGLISIGA